MTDLSPDAFHPRGAAGVGRVGRVGQRAYAGGGALQDEPPSEVSQWSQWARSVDHVSILICVALFCIGVVLAFAASPALAESNQTSPFYYAWRHLIFGAPAFVLLFTISFFSPSAVRRLAVFATFAGLVALALLPLYGTDFDQGGTRWYALPGLGSLQPSEFLKPALIVTCAWLLSASSGVDRGSNARDQGLGPAGAGASLALLATAAALLVIQPDYGQTALILVVWAAMYFVSGASLVTLAALALCAFVGAIIAFQVEPHIAYRVTAFWEEGGAPPQQLLDARQAMINGGWFGVGPGDGVNKLTLAEANSDFIFAVAIEEYGFALGVLLVVLFSFITLNALWRLRRVEAAFPRLAGIGLALLFGLQAFVNMAVTVQLLPAKGMTLPFISYGGSSLIGIGLTMGMLLALTRRRLLDETRRF
ncbi:MAG: putative peptidoglycan glycosyltransferase FtsW [Pseudomonadota bacterium]